MMLCFRLLGEYLRVGHDRVEKFGVDKDSLIDAL